MNDILLFKIIIFGDESLGKANFIQRSLSDLFSSESKKILGVEIYGPKIVSVDGQKAKLQTWDFSGDPRFMFFHSNYIRGAQGGLFVCNIAEPSSFVHIDYWLSSVRKKNRAKDLFPILVVGILPDESEERQLTTEEGTKLAESRNLNGYIECSPKTGENVDKVFEDLTRLMLSHEENFFLEKEKKMEKKPREDNYSKNLWKGVNSNVRSKFIGAKMSYPKAPFILPLHPPLPSKSYRDQIIYINYIYILSKIQRFWDLTNSRIIDVALVQGKDTILYSTDNWDISADVGRVISSWRSLNAPFIVISGVKYSVLHCTSEELVATSIRGGDHILIAKEEDSTLILHVEPDSGSSGNLDRGPPRHPGSASEAALVDF